jgi:predicted ATPase
VEEYLTTYLPGALLPAGLARLVHQRTSGNPLFMVNVVDY